MRGIISQGRQLVHLQRERAIVDIVDTMGYDAVSVGNGQFDMRWMEKCP